MKHAAVIGAGIVGSACAAALVRDGWRVTVVETGTVAGGATAAGMGHVVVMDDSEAQFALTRYSRELWEQAASRLPAAVGFDRCGTLWVAADEEETAEVARKSDFYGARRGRYWQSPVYTCKQLRPRMRTSPSARLEPGASIWFRSFRSDLARAISP